MATNINSTDVNLIGIDHSVIPAWATQATQEGILRHAMVNTRNTTVSNDLLKSILHVMATTSTTASRTNANFSALVRQQANLVDQAKKHNKQILDATIAGLNNTKKKEKTKDGNQQTDNNNNNPNDVDFKQLNVLQRILLSFKTQGMTEREQARYLKDLKQTMKESKEGGSKIQKAMENFGIDPNGPVGKLMGVTSTTMQTVGDLKEGMSTGLGGLLEVGGTGASMLGSAIGGALAMYGGGLGITSYVLGQSESRFDMASEIRQSGLMTGLDDIRMSFADLAVEVTNNRMTMQEATEFTRKFSQSVGVIGVSESLRFIDTMARSNDLIGKYGLKFGQVANISGEYLSTLERMGMLETISSQQRDAGMISFMENVSETAKVLKVSMEDAAKMISEFLGRNDISSMMAFNPNLSTEQQMEIGQMGKLGPLGEMIAVGAIDPNQFFTTPQADQLNSTVLAPYQGEIMQAITDLNAGRVTAEELSATLYPKLLERMERDPVLNQLVHSGDQQAQDIVAEVRRISMTAKDGLIDAKETLPDTDKAMAGTVEAFRGRAAEMEGVVSRVIQSMDQYGDGLEILLNNERDIVKMQTDLIKDATNLSRDAIAKATYASIRATEVVTNTGLYTARAAVDAAQWVAGTTDRDYEVRTNEIMNSLPDDIETAVRSAVEDGWYPDGLTKEEMIEILKEGKIGNTELDEDSKNALVRLNNEANGETRSMLDDFTSWRDDILDSSGNIKTTSYSYGPGGMGGIPVAEPSVAIKLSDMITELYTNDIIGANGSALSESESVQSTALINEILSKQATDDEREETMKKMVELLKQKLDLDAAAAAKLNNSTTDVNSLVSAIQELTRALN